MSPRPPPHDADPDATALAHTGRDRLTLIRGRTYLLLRRLRRSGEVPPGPLEAGLLQIDAASRDLLAVIERLERGIMPPKDGGPADARADD